MKSKFDDREFRHAFVSANVKRGIAYQLRALRNAKKMNQTQFGELIGKPQPVICRLENPNYGKVSVQTLIEIANTLDVGLLVKFVPHDRVLREVGRLSQEELAPHSYEEVKRRSHEQPKPEVPVTTAAKGSLDLYLGRSSKLGYSENSPPTKIEVHHVAENTLNG